MKTPCPALEDLPEIAAFPPSDPTRAHIDDCPRCRARLLAMEAFRAGPREVAGSRPDEARRALDAFIDREFCPQPRRVRTRPRSTWNRWRIPTLIFVPAACVLLAILLIRPGEQREPERMILRGEAPRGALALHPVVVGESGTIAFSWTGNEGATGYQLRVYNADLEAVYRSAVTAETTLALSISQFEGVPRTGAPTIWRVAAYKGAREVQLSAVGTLDLP